MYLVLQRMLGGCYRRWLKFLLSCLRDVFQALINSLVDWFCESILGLILFQIFAKKGTFREKKATHPNSWKTVSCPSKSPITMWSPAITIWLTPDTTRREQRNLLFTEYWWSMCFSCQQPRVNIFWLVGWLAGWVGGSVGSWLFTFIIKFNQRLLTLSVLTSNPSPVLRKTVLLLSVPISKHQFMTAFFQPVP